MCMPLFGIITTQGWHFIQHILRSTSIHSRNVNRRSSMEIVRKQFQAMPPNQGGEMLILEYMWIVIIPDKREQEGRGMSSSFT